MHGDILLLRISGARRRAAARRAAVHVRPERSALAGDLRARAATALPRRGPPHPPRSGARPDAALRARTHPRGAAPADERVHPRLARLSVAARSPFPTYLQMRARVPLWAWAALRVVGLLATAALLVALFVAPEIGLLAFWGVLIPALPLLFFVAPGAWRNACPLAP